MLKTVESFVRDYFYASEDSYCKNVDPPQPDLDLIQSQNHSMFLKTEIDMLILKFIWKSKGSKSIKTIFTKTMRLTLSYLQM